MENSAAALSAVAQVYLLSEFWPDLKTLLLRHEPSKMKALQGSTAERWDEFSAAHLTRNTNKH